MDRRYFLLGLLGVAGAATLGGVAATPARAAPFRTLPDLEPSPEAADAPGGHAPDGTEVEDAQYYYRRRRRWRRRYYGRRYYRPRYYYRRRYYRPRYYRRRYWAPWHYRRRYYW